VGDGAGGAEAGRRHDRERVDRRLASNVPGYGRVATPLPPKCTVELPDALQFTVPDVWNGGVPNPGFVTWTISSFSADGSWAAASATAASAPTSAHAAASQRLAGHCSPSSGPARGAAGPPPSSLPQAGSSALSQIVSTATRRLPR
jgi:hypothetical protein